MKKNIFFLSGLAGALLYLLADIIGHLIEPGFIFISNPVSELSETGADHRLLFGVILVSSSIMGVVFGITILSKYKFKENKLIFIGGSLLGVMSLCTTLTATIFPMDPVGSDATIPGIMHLVLVGISVLMIFPAVILLGIGIKRKYGLTWFRNYSLITLGILIISGGSSPFIVNNMEHLMGLAERINVYTFYLWIVIMADNLFKENLKDLKKSGNNEK